MFKTAYKLAFCALLLTGTAAKAYEFKSNTNDTLVINGKAFAFAIYDHSSAAHSPKTLRTASPVEIAAKVRVESSYTRQFNDDLSASAVARLDYTDGALDIKRAYGVVESKSLGTLTFGKYRGFQSVVAGLSDVDILVGAPATSSNYLKGTNKFFGGDGETGIQYSRDISGVTLVASIDGGQDADSLIAVKGNYDTGIVLKRDYRVGVGAQYALAGSLQGFTVAASYNVTGYKTQFTDDAGNKSLVGGNKVAQSGVVGIQYDAAGLTVGATATGQYYKNYTGAPNAADPENNRADNVAQGYELGVQYDISGQGVGLRPSAQIDYRLNSQKIHTRDADGKIVTGNKSIVEATNLELGLSYYVNTSLSYMAAISLDLRSTDDIAVADGISDDKAKAKSHDFYGVGVSYSF